MEDPTPRMPFPTEEEMFNLLRKVREYAKSHGARCEAEAASHEHGAPKYFIYSGKSLAFEEISGLFRDDLRDRWRAWFATLTPEQQEAERAATKKRVEERREI